MSYLVKLLLLAVVGMGVSTVVQMGRNEAQPYRTGVAMGQMAQLLAAARPGDALRLTGFLSAKSLKSRTPVLHVNAIEFLEGMNHGI